MATVHVEIYDKYWSAADKSAVRQALLDLAQAQNMRVNQLRLTRTFVPERVVVTFDTPDSPPAWSHETVRARVAQTRGV